MFQALPISDERPRRKLVRYPTLAQSIVRRKFEASRARA
jgi:hypothetical protein